MGVCTTCNAEVDDEMMEDHMSGHEGAAEEMESTSEEGGEMSEDAEEAGGDESSMEEGSEE